MKFNFLQKSFVCLLFVTCVFGANILYIGGIPSPSHHIYNRALVFAMAERGHNVTMLTNDLEKEKHKNAHFILMEDSYESLGKSFDLNEMIKLSALQSIQGVYGYGKAVCVANFATKGLKYLLSLNNTLKVDLIIFDNTFGQCMYPIIDRFGKPPVVAITAFLLPPYLANAMGTHLYSSYYPHYSLSASNKMSFFERTYSFILVYLELFYRKYVFEPDQDRMASEYFGKDIRPMAEVERSFSLLLSNTDPILDYPIPLPPSIIPIGGMHVRPAKKLPQDLEKIMDIAKHGVILFAMGTNLQFHLFPESTKIEFVAAFSKIKQTVLWKYDGEIPNLPPNVVLRKWLPQNDILGHPKCKLFISHGGALSTQEAIYHGVPIVGVPGFVDQRKNVYKLVHKGFGLKLDLSSIKRDDVYNTIMEVLNKPRYTNTIKEASKKYRDQPQTAQERAIFWIEYILRHGDTKELDLPARDMYFFQTSNLDVVLFLAMAPVTLLFIVVKLIKLLCGNKNREMSKKKSKTS